MSKESCIKMQPIFVGLFLLVNYCDGFIVPSELPDALFNVIYPFVPKVNKGTVSRFGFGFRLGKHSDFQFILDLGPQKNNRTIGGSNTSKRMAQFKSRQTVKPPSAKVDGSNFLQKWASEMKTKTTQKTRKPQTASAENDSLKSLFGTKDQYPLPSSPVISDTALRQLQQLMYAKQSDSPSDQSPQAIGTLPSKTMEKKMINSRKPKSKST